MTYEPKNKKEHRFLVKLAESWGYGVIPKKGSNLGNNIRMREYIQSPWGYCQYIIPNSVEGADVKTYEEFVELLFKYSPLVREDDDRKTYVWLLGQIH